MKTEKSARVTQVKNNYRQYQGNSGDTMCVHFISFENGDEGEYHSTSLVCTEFEQGQISNYSIEQRGSNSMKPEFRIRPIIGGSNNYNSNTNRTNSNRTHQSAPINSNVQKRQPSNNNASNSSQRKENAIMAQHAISKSIELLGLKQIDKSELYSKAHEILKWTMKMEFMSVEEIMNAPIESELPLKEKKKETSKTGKSGKKQDPSKLF